MSDFIEAAKHKTHNAREAYINTLTEEAVFLLTKVFHLTTSQADDLGDKIAEFFRENTL